jgi:hypothetical protein
MDPTQRHFKGSSESAIGSRFPLLVYSKEERSTKEKEGYHHEIVP